MNSKITLDYIELMWDYLGTWSDEIKPFNEAFVVWLLQCGRSRGNGEIVLKISRNNAVISEVRSNNYTRHIYGNGHSISWNISYNITVVFKQCLTVILDMDHMQ